MMEAKVSLRGCVVWILSWFAICTDIGGKLSHSHIVHDLQSDARITVVKLATGSCIYISTAPVHDSEPAAADLADGYPMLFVALPIQPPPTLGVCRRTTIATDSAIQSKLKCCYLVLLWQNGNQSTSKLLYQVMIVLVNQSFANICIYIYVFTKCTNFREKKRAMPHIDDAAMQHAKSDVFDDEEN